nr:KaiC domain-containing protein [Halobaculum gomorrense]
MSDEDDWFERALREEDDTDEESAGSAGAEADADAEAEAGSDAADAVDTADADAAHSGDRDAVESIEGDLKGPVDGFDDAADADGFDEAFADGFDDDRSEGGGGAVEGEGFGGLDGHGGVDGGGEESPPRADRTDDPADLFGGAGPGSGDDTDAGDGAAEPPGAATDEGDGADPFGEDFAAAMQDAPAGQGAGGGAGFDAPGGGFGGDFEGGFGGDAPDFDEEEFDSDIDRIDIGIEGLDEMILGGVPERSLMTVIGSAGTGKTTFGLQFLNEALENGGHAVYITLEESQEAIISTAEEKGWEYRRYEAEDRLAVISMDPIEMANSLDSIRDDISRLVSEFGADRLVLDSVSLLEMMYDHPSRRRSEVFDFARSLKGAGVTTMLTSEASEENPYASRHGIVEYLTDAVFVLQYVRPSDFRETRLAVEIQKIRDANHSRETKPYEIMGEGLSVYRQANIF